MSIYTHAHMNTIIRWYHRFQMFVYMNVRVYMHAHLYAWYMWCGYNAIQSPRYICVYTYRYRPHTRILMMYTAYPENTSASIFFHPISCKWLDLHTYIYIQTHVRTNIYIYSMSTWMGSEHVTSPKRLWHRTPTCIHTYTYSVYVCTRVEAHNKLVSG